MARRLYEWGVKKNGSRKSAWKTDYAMIMALEWRVEAIKKNCIWTSSSTDNGLARARLSRVLAKQNGNIIQKLYGQTNDMKSTTGTFTQSAWYSFEIALIAPAPSLHFHSVFLLLFLPQSALLFFGFAALPLNCGWILLHFLREEKKIEFSRLWHAMHAQRIVWIHIYFSFALMLAAFLLNLAHTHTEFHLGG